MTAKLAWADKINSDMASHVLIATPGRKDVRKDFIQANVGYLKVTPVRICGKDYEQYSTPGKNISAFTGGYKKVIFPITRSIEAMERVSGRAAVLEAFYELITNGMDKAKEKCLSHALQIEENSKDVNLKLIKEAEQLLWEKMLEIKTRRILEPFVISFIR